MQRLEDPLFAGELSLGGKVLPAQKPAHIDGGRDRLDLFARSRECEAMDALEDAPLAPFDLVVLVGCWMFKGAAHQKPLHLHRKKALEGGGGFEAEMPGEDDRSRRSENL